MHLTYQGILRANQIEWIADAPEESERGKAVRVFVTLLEPTPPAADSAQGQRMAEALEKLAALPRDEGLADPVGWQREARQDRPLPGREE